MSDKIQAVLSKEEIERLKEQAKKQDRKISNLSRRYIIEGLIKDEKK